MYKLDLKEIENLIDNSNFVYDKNNEKNDVMKDIMKGMFSALCQYTNDTIDGLHASVCEPKKKSGFGEVVSALVSNDIKDKFYEMSNIGIDISTSDIVFVDEDYRQLRGVVGDNDVDKKFKGKYVCDGDIREFEYQLKYDNSFHKMQDIIFKITELYGSEYPIVNSPYVTKCFRACPTEELPEDIEEIHYDFEENGIKVLENTSLLWNVKLNCSGSKAADEKIPYGNTTKYVYLFSVDKNTGNHYYVIPQNNQTLVYSVEFLEKETKIIINREMEEFLLVEKCDIDWGRQEIKLLSSQKRIYTNKVDKGLVHNPRILSKGDVEYAIAPFRNYKGNTCEIVSAESDISKIILRYSSKYKYKNMDRIRYAKLSRVYVKFFLNEEVLYPSDYINFALSYLEYYYPEIEWVGGV